MSERKFKWSSIVRAKKLSGIEVQRIDNCPSTGHLSEWEPCCCVWHADDHPIQKLLQGLKNNKVPEWVDVLLTEIDDFDRLAKEDKTFELRY